MKFMIFGAHFKMGLVTSLTYGLVNLSLLGLVFYAADIDHIAGFSLYEVYFVFAVTQLIFALTNIFFSESANMFKYHIYDGWLEKIQLGQLDRMQNIEYRMQNIEYRIQNAE